MNAEIIKYSDMQMDALREISNIGAGYAATALSKLTGKQILIKVPSVNLAKIEEAPMRIKMNPDKVVDGVYFKLSGEFVGGSLVAFLRPDSKFLVDLIIGDSVGITKSETENIENSMLMELCNILTGTYFTSLESMTGLVVIPSIPFFASGTAGAVFNSTLAEVNQISEIVVIVEIEFIEASNTVKGWFYVMPDVTSINKMLNALEVK